MREGNEKLVDHSRDHQENKEVTIESCFPGESMRIPGLSIGGLIKTNNRNPQRFGARDHDSVGRSQDVRLDFFGNQQVQDIKGPEGRIRKNGYDIHSL